MIQKKSYLIIFASILSILIVGFSIWWGGNDRWRMIGLNLNSTENSTAIQQFEELLKEKPDSAELKYNLAYLYYRQGDFNRAVSLLQQITNPDERSAELLKKVYYNLGNNAFRLAEKAKDLESAIRLLGESLRNYRLALEIEKQEKSYASSEMKIDPDLLANYALVQKRLKVMSDKLEKRDTEAEMQKNLYQLASELLEREQAIQKRLVGIEADQRDKTNIKVRNQLLKQRVENKRKLQIIRDKILQELDSAPKPPGKQPPISAKSI